MGGAEVGVGAGRVETAAATVGVEMGTTSGVVDEARVSSLLRH